MELLERRMHRLERENRRLKWAGIVAILTLSSVIVMAQARPTTMIDAQTVQASSFVLVDGGTRQIRGILTAEGGSPMLSLLDEFQQSGVLITAEGDSEGFIRVGGSAQSGYRNGTVSMSVIAGPSGGPTLTVRRAGGDVLWGVP